MRLGAFKSFFEIPQDIKTIDTQKVVKKQLFNLFVLNMGAW